MKNFVLASAFALPLLASPAFAAGSGEETAPSKPHCKDSEVYDEKTNKCVTPKDSNLDVDSMYQTVRSLAYDGRYADAQAVLAYMPADDDRTLTYLGFTERKLGNVEAAMAYYRRALVVNPANVLARSYMGQGFVEEGKIADAITQLREIRAYGGSGSWAEASLRTAIATGKTYNY